MSHSLIGNSICWIIGGMSQPILRMCYFAKSWRAWLSDPGDPKSVTGAPLLAAISSLFN